MKKIKVIGTALLITALIASSTRMVASVTYHEGVSDLEKVKDIYGIVKTTIKALEFTKEINNYGDFYVHIETEINEPINHIEDFALEIKELIIKMELAKTSSQNVEKAKDIQKVIALRIKHIKDERDQLYGNIPYAVLKEAIERKTKLFKKFSMEGFKKVYETAQLIKKPLLHKANKEDEAKELIAAMENEAKKTVQAQWNKFKIWVEKNKIDKLATTKFANEAKFDKAVRKAQRFIKESAPESLLKNPSDIKNLVTKLNTKALAVKKVLYARSIDQCWNNAVNFVSTNQEYGLTKLKEILNVVKNMRGYLSKKDDKKITQEVDPTVIKQAGKAATWTSWLSLEKAKSAVNNAQEFMISAAKKTYSGAQKAMSVIKNATHVIKNSGKIKASVNAVLKFFSECSSALYNKTQTDKYLIAKMSGEISPKDEKSKLRDLHFEKEFNDLMKKNQDLINKIKVNELKQSIVVEAVAKPKPSLEGVGKGYRDILETFKKEMEKQTKKAILESKKLTEKAKQLVEQFEKNAEKMSKKELKKEKAKLEKEETSYWSRFTATVSNIVGLNQYDNLFDDDDEKKVEEKEKQKGQKQLGQ